MKQLISGQEKMAVAQARELQLQLQREITKLRRRDADLDELLHVDDHIHLIQVTDALYISARLNKWFPPRL